MISIDEHEIGNLLVLCDDVFGNENFVECLVYDKKAAPKGVPPVNMIVGVHEYIVCYSRSENFKFIGSLRNKDGFSNPDNDPRGEWRNTNLKSTVKDKSESFEIVDPDTGRKFCDTWAFSKTEIVKMIEEKRVLFPKSNDGQVRQKEYYSEFGSPYIPIKSNLGLFDAQKNTEMLSSLMGDKIFQNPKHFDLMQLIMSITVDPNSIVLDFFAGSGTTGHAVIAQNAANNGNRRYILVQLPEPLDPSDKDQKTAADFCDSLKKPRTIAELTKERLRRAGKKIREEWEAKQTPSENPKSKKSAVKGPSLFSDPDLAVAAQTPVQTTPPDLGFRVFKLDSTNIMEWDPKHADLKEAMQMSIEHLKDDRSNDDILYELLLKLGIDLCTPIETTTIAKHQVHAIGAGTLLACLSSTITQNDLEPLALGIVSWWKQLVPTDEDKKNRKTSVIFRDSAFKDDIIKTNLSAILHQHGLSTVRSL